MIRLKLRYLRQERNMSQEALAAAVGVHQTMISAIERGTADPSLSLLRALASFFDVEPAYFLSEQPVPDPSPAPSPA